MKSIFITLSCIIIITLFSLFPEGFKLHAENNTSNAYSAKGFPQESYEALSKDATVITDFKFPSRSTPLDNSELKPWKGPKLVVIDPGHGGKDPGASTGKLLEKDVSLAVALKLERILAENQIPTYITRNDDRFVELHDRIEAANERNAALFVSIHCNWFKHPSLNGVTTLYYPSDKLSAGFLLEKDYAKLLQSELVKSIGTRNIGIEDRRDLAVLKHAKMPTALVELGFLSNPRESALLASEEFKNKAAEGIAEGIRKALIKMSVRKTK